MNVRLKYCITAFLFLTFLNSCRKDIPPRHPQSGGNISTGKRLIICNEGNFGLGNAGISVYDPIGGTVLADAFGSANNNQGLGDILQSYGRFNEKYYWLVNNSGKVVITDRNFTKLATITGFISPRYIEFVSNNKAYISNLLLNGHANYIQVLDLNTNMISKTIRVDGWTEQMVQSYGKVFVTNMRKKYLYVINTSNDLVIDSIFLNAGSSCIVKDQNEKLWVSCDTSGGNSSRLVRIDPLKDSVELDISLQNTHGSAARLCINGIGNNLYYLMNNLYRVPITFTSAPTIPFIQQSARTFYGLCIDPEDETIYVSDALDYNQAGLIYRYRSDGTLITNFRAGVIPGYMSIE